MKDNYKIYFMGGASRRDTDEGVAASSDGSTVESRKEKMKEAIKNLNSNSDSVSTDNGKFKISGKAPEPTTTTTTTNTSPSTGTTKIKGGVTVNGLDYDTYKSMEKSFQKKRDELQSTIDETFKAAIKEYQNRNEETNVDYDAIKKAVMLNNPVIKGYQNALEAITLDDNTAKDYDLWKNPTVKTTTTSNYTDTFTESDKQTSNNNEASNGKSLETLTPQETTSNSLLDLINDIPDEEEAETEAEAEAPTVISSTTDEQTRGKVELTPEQEEGINRIEEDTINKVNTQIAPAFGTGPNAFVNPDGTPMESTDVKPRNEYVGLGKDPEFIDYLDEWNEGMEQNASIEVSDVRMKNIFSKCLSKIL